MRLQNSVQNFNKNINKIQRSDAKKNMCLKGKKENKIPIIPSSFHHDVFQFHFVTTFPPQKKKNLRREAALQRPMRTVSSGTYHLRSMRVFCRSERRNCRQLHRCIAQSLHFGSLMDSLWILGLSLVLILICHKCLLKWCLSRCLQESRAPCSMDFHGRPSQNA